MSQKGDGWVWGERAADDISRRLEAAPPKAQTADSEFPPSADVHQGFSASSDKKGPVMTNISIFECLL